MLKGGLSVKFPKNNLQPSIVFPSILFIGIVVISCIFFPIRTDTVLSSIKEYIFSSCSWVYILCVASFFSWSSCALENSVISAWETKMKNRNFLFFLVMHVVFGRHGHWFDVLRRSRTDCPLISSFARVSLSPGTNERSHAEHSFSLGYPCLGYLWYHRSCPGLFGIPISASRNPAFRF